MARITEEQVHEALLDNPSFEDGTYYLHVTEDGRIVSNIRAADCTFTFEIDEDLYFHDGLLDQLRADWEKAYDVYTAASAAYRDDDTGSRDLLQALYAAEEDLCRANEALEAGHSLDDYWEKENDADDPDFGRVVSSLTYEANKWLSSLDDEEDK